MIGDRHLPVVRPALVGDLPAVLDLLQSAHLPLDGVAESFGEHYAVAEYDGMVVGVAGMEVYGPEGLFRSAAVAPLWRGRGVGEALARDRLTWSAARGLESVWLLTTTAAGYFPRFGFQVTDRREANADLQRSKEFAEACPASAIAMRLVLPRLRESALT